MELLELLIFLTVSLGIVAGAYVWTEVARRDQVRAAKRLGDLLSRSAPEPSEPTERLFKDPKEFDRSVTAPLPAVPDDPTMLPPLGRDAPAPTVGGPTPTPLRTRWDVRLGDRLDHAGLRIPPYGFLAISGGGALVLFLVGWLAQGVLLAVPASLVGAVAPWLYLRLRLTARRDKLLNQLPSAFDLMARILRSGLSMPQAFQGVAEAFKDPIAAEFRRCRDEQNLGVFPEVSFRGMAERTGVLEMKIFVMAMLIQRQTGGNLSEVLERLAALIRERLRLRSQVRTLTAEGRLQAVVLLVLPAVVFFAIRFVNRPYTDVLLAHPEWLAVTGLLMAAGAFWIRKVIDIE